MGPQGISIGFPESAEVVATEATGSFGSSTTLRYRVKWVQSMRFTEETDKLLVEKLDSLKDEDVISFTNTTEAIAHLRSLMRNR